MFINFFIFLKNYLNKNFIEGKYLINKFKFINKNNPDSNN